MGDALLTGLSMENHHPSTILSMDSSASSSHEELELEMNRQVILTRPPDINLPLSAERSPPPQPWNPEHCDILDVGLSTQVYETESFLSVPKVGRKCAKRVDSIWGAWFFFSFYFKPVLNEKSKAKIIRDSNGVSGFEKSDLQLDTFMVQHDMENMYMWVFKERPENALGKMQLRSYMNGHSRQGERPFPFSVDKGFARSHRMQRKHYRGLSNPQCVHGIEIVTSPNLMGLDEDDRKRWTELTGREVNFSIPTEASDYGSWRNLPNTEFELERPPTVKANQQSHTKKLLNGSVLNLSTQLTNHSNGDVLDLSPVCNKRKKDFFSQGNDEDCYLAVNAPERIPDLEVHTNGPHWLNEFSGVMRNACGPVTAAKTVYEDAEGYLIVISLPFVDLQRVKVSWRNTLTHGIIKVSCMSTSRTPFIKRHNRTFKLTDPSSEHCPPGEFVREIPLSTRIPEDANIEAYYDGPGTVLEILVPKLREGPEEHEVRVCLRPHHGGNDLKLT
ncbi:HSP20-like chaperones superfamily protein [Perilla frutescens var. hirtella]|uniref:HSP20-like chaperones superfamily protein n=1 Tax=Perilla frutescens var. hirtella TaxID=608512 RepID=A0AAD4J160_PERFH|nr:HSP20-like chaperones superfamily protein [Perilla frutescens var. frutescens]KAH6824850.1 HSP20-like chaperones superfamily protein [Perilla frutescens var. hirtella]